jgi:hypothetical protein
VWKPSISACQFASKATRMFLLSEAAMLSPMPDVGFSESSCLFKTNCPRLGGFSYSGCHGWTLRLRDSINLSVHLSEAEVNPYPTPLSMLKPRNLLRE